MAGLALLNNAAFHSYVVLVMSAQTTSCNRAVLSFLRLGTLLYGEGRGDGCFVVTGTFREPDAAQALYRIVLVQELRGRGILRKAE